MCKKHEHELAESAKETHRRIAEFNKLYRREMHPMDAYYKLCALCGNRTVTNLKEYWDPDYGHQRKEICKSCWKEWRHVKPKKTDWAYRRYQDYLKELAISEEENRRLLEKYGAR